MVYISTGGFSDKKPIETSKAMIDIGIDSIELSSGLADSLDISDFIALKSECNFQVHNYFPPPEEPFVFNLASMNSDIAKKSLDHAKNAIRWSCELDNPVYSFHAGFLLDPRVDELGKRIKNRFIANREDGLMIFMERINKLSEFAAQNGASLLIENNVLSFNNYNEFKTDPFLMSTPEECRTVMENSPENVNLLIDVAHLKVSANSLGYNPSEMFSICDSWIKAYHFSDNDGLSDSNHIFDQGSWFGRTSKKI
tara:strand:+ start:191 stop:952 length:762 start_codon:yes stop_codon:yes gene_type:complete